MQGLHSLSTIHARGRGGQASRVIAHPTNADHKFEALCD
jgi:hypothetical protein